MGQSAETGGGRRRGRGCAVGGSRRRSSLPPRPQLQPRAAAAAPAPAHLLQRLVPVALVPLVGDCVVQRLQCRRLLAHAQQLIRALQHGTCGAAARRVGGTPCRPAAGHPQLLACSMRAAGWASHADQLRCIPLQHPPGVGGACRPAPGTHLLPALWPPAAEFGGLAHLERALGLERRGAAPEASPEGHREPLRAQRSWWTLHERVERVGRHKRGAVSVHGEAAVMVEAGLPSRPGCAMLLPEPVG